MFDLNQYLNDITKNIYNPGNFSDKVSFDTFSKPMVEQYNLTVRPAQQTMFTQNTLDPFNQKAQNQVQDYTYGNTSSGNWRTGNYQRNLGQLTGQIDLERNKLIAEQKGNEMSNFNDFNNMLYEMYQNQSNDYLNKNFLLPGQIGN